MKLEIKEKYNEDKEDKEEYNISPDIALVRDSLEYYDKHYELYKNKFNKVNYLKIVKSNNDHQQDELHFYDKNKEILFKSRFEFIGIHEPQMNVWSWAWSIPYLNKKSTSIIRKILSYGTELDINAQFLKSELITSRFKINHPIQLDIHAGIASYLAKKPVIYKFRYYEYAKYDENNLVNIREYGIENDPKISDISDYMNYYFYLLDYEQFLENK
jgi:hypothetical protein